MTICVPYVNARKTDPNVAGAYTPPNCLSHPTRTDHSQIIDTVRTGGHPRDDRAQLPGRVCPADATLDVLNRTRCPINSDSPARSANTISGTRPAHDTRFSSSKTGVARDQTSGSFTMGAFCGL